LVYADNWPAGEPETRLVLIGKGLSRALIQEKFAACLAIESRVLDRSIGSI